ncbi:dual specificity protein phosphatase family protein [Candidatus Uabimicrobium sp. HlEnr_7]|uniref:dual specificity protein phosphatase family protein n=1 Tax=Candidatus Uabimicrobium helgolandensis TaxID=3095367 RepID=UPI0035569F95
MNWITDKIAIGNHIDAQNKKLLQEHNMKSILGLDGKKRKKINDIEDSEVFNFIDGYGNSIQLFTRAVDTLADFIENNSPVLVYCHAGRSRSPSIVAGYFIKYQNMDVDKAVNLISKKRQINIATGLKELLYCI